MFRCRSKRAPRRTGKRRISVRANPHPAPKPVVRRAFCRTPYGPTFSRTAGEGNAPPLPRALPISVWGGSGNWAARSFPPRGGRCRCEATTDEGDRAKRDGSQVEEAALDAIPQEKRSLSKPSRSARPPLIRRPFGTPPSPARGEGTSQGGLLCESDSLAGEVGRGGASDLSLAHRRLP